MAVVKPLYLGKTMEDLNRLSNADTKKTTNPRILASSAVKLYEGAARNVASGDEEKSYILYMRCMSLFQTIRKSALYAKEKKSIEVVLEKVNVMIALGEAERLSKSLAKRYQALRTDRSDGDGARDDKDEPRARPDGSASVATSSSEVYQKLKIGRDTLIQPKIATEDVSNGHLVARKEAPIIVSCEELYHLMKCNAKLLIFDTRSEEEFAVSRIRFDSIVHVPEHLLVSGISAGVILKNIKKDYCELWYSRRDFDHVILMDRNTTAKLFDANRSLPVTNLKNAIYKFDSRAELQSEPRLLEGGFKSWLFHYPTYCTNPNPPKIKNKPKSSSSKIDLFDYPSLPGDEKEPKPAIDPTKEPSPPPTPPPLPPEPKPTPQIPSRLTKPAQLSQPSRRPQGNVPASNGLTDNASLPQPTIRAQTPTIPPTPRAPATVPAPAPAPVPAPAPATVPAPAPATVPAPAPAPAPAPSNPIVPPQRPPPQPTIQPPAPTLPTPPRAPVVSAPNGPNVNGGSSFVAAAAAAAATVPTGPSQASPPLQPAAPTPDARSKPAQTFPAAPSNRTPTQPTVPSPGVNPIPSQAIKTSTMSSVSKGTPAPVHSTPRNPQERAVATNFSGGARSAKTVPVPPHNSMPASKPPSASGAEPSSASTSTAVLSNVSTSIPKAPKPPALPNSTPATAPTPKPSSQKPSHAKKETPDAKPAPQTSPKSPVSSPSIKSDPETPAKTPPVTASPSIRSPQNPQQTSTSSPTSGAPSAAPARPSQPKPIASKSESSASTFVASRPPVFSNPEAAQFRAAAAPTSPPPSYLPRGWEKCHDSLTNRFYYKDHNTMTTYWTLPKSVVEAMMTKPRPSVDRSEKPRQAIPTVNRENKPIAIAKPSRNLAPVYGNVGHCLTGLKNMGNTCFMSSILQCLNNTTPLAQRFLGVEYRRFINKTNPLGSGGCIAEEFAEVCKALWSGQFKSITPRDFKLAMSRFAPQFSGYDQQDSQELLAFLLDGLHEDLNAVRDKPYIEEEDNSDMTDEQAAQISWENHRRRNQSIIVDLFQGQFKSTVACSYCGKKSVTFEAFMYLSLPLKASRKNCSLAECLELFTAVEEVSGEDKWLCSNCKKYRKARKKLDIWKLPPILLIHLKRFSYKGLWRQKLETMVDFPVSGLDMRNYIEGPKTQSSYNLYGVSNHYGTMTGGHYTAFCKNSYSTKWHSFDDHIVKEASVGSVKSRAAYILFYTSCNFQPPRLTRTA